MSELEIRQNIIQALERMPLIQQIKLLEFINAVLSFQKPNHNTKGILQFAGIFDEQDSREFRSSLADCEQIDHDEW